MVQNRYLYLRTKVKSEEREINFDSLNSLTRNKEMIEYFQPQIFI